MNWIPIFGLIPFLFMVFAHELVSEKDGLCIYQNKKKQKGWVVKTKLVAHTFRDFGCYSLRGSNCVTTETFRETYMEWDEIDSPVEKLGHCCNGYVMDQLSPLTCKPACTPKCENGSCIKPGECECQRGFEKSDLPNVCKPTCQPPCKNGKCTNVNKCQCDEGYWKLNNITCLPHCSKPCENGMCVKPEFCKCNKGYKLSLTDKYKCEPICSLECWNGECVAPEICNCSHGYKKENDGLWNVCVPSCSEPCINGYCSSPNNCTCFDKYEKILYNNSLCLPKCQQDCINGTCIGPDECSCLPNFIPTFNPDICIPYCSNGCENGNCIAPESCSCLENYEMVDDVCAPICKESCINGNCTAPNFCSCQEGAVKVNHNECYQICENNEETECWHANGYAFQQVLLPIEKNNFNIKINKDFHVENFECFSNKDAACTENSCDGCSKSFICYAEQIYNNSIINSVCLPDIYKNSFNKTDLYGDVSATELTEVVNSSLNLFVTFLHKNGSRPKTECKLCRCPEDEILTLNQFFEMKFYPCKPELSQQSVPDEKSVVWIHVAIPVAVITVIAIFTFGIVWAIRKNVEKTYNIEDKERRTKFEEEETNLMDAL